MIWQDIALAAAQIIFFFALFPTIFSKKSKPSISTSIINTIVLVFIVYVDITLKLYFFAFGVFLVAIAWAILAVQKYLIEKKERRNI